MVALLFGNQGWPCGFKVRRATPDWGLGQDFHLNHVVGAEGSPFALLRIEQADLMVRNESLPALRLVARSLQVVGVHRSDQTADGSILLAKPHANTLRRVNHAANVRRCPLGIDVVADDFEVR